MATETARAKLDGQRRASELERIGRPSRAEDSKGVGSAE
jgi:hypothetical protein